jgi:hypothetical protein
MISVLVCLNNSTELGTVFIARGVGSISGAAISTILFKRFDGNNILCCTLALIFTLLLMIPFKRNKIIPKSRPIIRHKYTLEELLLDALETESVSRKA